MSSVGQTRRGILAAAGRVGVGSAAGLLAAACGGQEGATAGSQTKTPVTLQLLDPPSSDANALLLDKVFKAFQEKYPWITLNNDATRFTLSRLSEKLTTQIVGGSAPDESFIHPSWSTSTFNKGFFLALDERVKKDKSLKAEDIFPACMDFYRWKGKLFGLPTMSGPSLIYFNKTMFDRNGVKSPDKWEREGKWTWETLADAAKQLTKREANPSTFGFPVLSRDLQFYVTIPIWAYGGEVTDKDEKLSRLHEPEALAGLQTQVDLQLTHRVIPTADEDKNIDKPAGRPINSGRIAMEMGHRGYVPDYVATSGFEIGVAPVPKGPKGRGARDGNAGRGVLNDSKHPDEAYLFVSYLSQWEGLGRAQLESGGGSPIRKQPFDDGSFKKLLAPWEGPYLDFYLDTSAKLMKVWRLPAAGPDFQTKFSAAFLAALDGKQSIKAAMDGLRPQLDDLLKQVS
jgi:multiple sugar transport system substrate-binding protein